MACVMLTVLFPVSSTSACGDEACVACVMLTVCGYQALLQCPIRGYLCVMGDDTIRGYLCVMGDDTAVPVRCG